MSIVVTVKPRRADPLARIAPPWAGRAAAASFRAAAWAYALLLALAALVFVAPPFQDIVEWLWQAQIAEALRTGALAPDAAVQRAEGPTPNAALQLMLQIGAAAGAPVAGARVVSLAIILAAMAIGVAATREEAPRRGAAMLLLWTAAALGAGYLNGYWNWLMGALGVALAAWRLERGWTPGPLIVAPLAVAAFAAHGMALAGFSVLIGTHWLLGRLRFTALLALAPAYLLFALYLTGAPELTGLQGQGARETADILASPLMAAAHKVYSLAKTGPYANFAMEAVGDHARAPVLYWTGAALNLLWTALAGLFVLLALREGARDPALRPTALAVAIMLALFLLLPSSLGRMVNPGERFLLMALMALALTRAGWRSRAVPMALAAVTALLPLKALLLLSHLGPAAAPPPVLYAAQEADKTQLFRHQPDRFWARMHPRYQATLSGGDPLLEFQTGLLRGVKDPRPYGLSMPVEARGLAVDAKGRGVAPGATQAAE